MAEKRKPTHLLADIKARVAADGVAAFTKSALDGGRKMRLTVGEMLDVIAALAHGDFYKSMTTHADHRLWQDVYHAPTPVGDDAYIKFTLKPGAVVISFKEKGT